MNDTLTLSDYIAIAKRRVWYLTLVPILVAALAVPVIHAWPRIYRSTATVSVESQQVPEELVQSTVVGYADQRIELVRQRVLTNATLRAIIDQHRLYPVERDRKPIDRLIEKLRERIVLERIQDRSSARPTVAFTLGVEDEDPETAAALAKQIVDMFLKENLSARTARAMETTEFLRRETARLDNQVAGLEKALASFKQEHGNALPEHLTMRLNMLQVAEAELKRIEGEAIALEQENRFLETQRASLGAILTATPAGNRMEASPAQQLAALKAEFAQKSAIYSAAHPDLRYLKNRIAGLEMDLPKGAAREIADAADPAQAQMQSKISSNTARLESLKSERPALKAKIEALQQQIIETPQVEAGLNELTRVYQRTLAEAEDIRAKQRSAELAESLEQEEKAERFVLLEPPQVPTIPVRPEETKLYLMGLLLALGSGAGSAFLAETLDTTIRGASQLAAVLQQHPFAVVPFIESAGDRRRTHARRLLISLGLAAILALTLLVVHLFVQPLEVLWRSLLQAAGVG